MAKVHLPRAHAGLQCLALDLAEFGANLKKARVAIARSAAAVEIARLDEAARDAGLR